MTIRPKRPNTVGLVFIGCLFILVAANAQPTAQIDKLFQGLASSDYTTRDNSAFELGQSKDPGVQDKIITSLDSKNAWLRKGAIAAVGYMASVDREKGMEAIPSLIQRLDDPLPVLRKKAVEQLFALTGQAHGDDYPAWQQWWYHIREGSTAPYTLRSFDSATGKVEVDLGGRWQVPDRPNIEEMTIIGTSGSAIASLIELRRQCDDVCQDGREILCYLVGEYQLPAAAAGLGNPLAAIQGALNISSVDTLARRIEGDSTFIGRRFVQVIEGTQARLYHEGREILAFAAEDNWPQASPRVAFLIDSLPYYLVDAGLKRETVRGLLSLTAAENVQFQYRQIDPPSRTMICD